MGNLRDMNNSLDDVAADLSSIAESLERMVALFERAEKGVLLLCAPFRKFLP